MTLQLDNPRVFRDISHYLQALCAEKTVKGVLIGLSGGIDSSLLTKLAVSSLGKERVHVYYLFERESQKKFAGFAEQLARNVGLKLVKVDIEPVLQAHGVYESAAAKIIHHSGWLNRWLYRILKTGIKEPPFLTSLKQDAHSHSSLDLASEHTDVKSLANQLFYSKHRVRRETLEALAIKENLLLLGAANRTEFMTGWFVSGGIDDVPYQPLSGLYKTQIFSLGEFLELPSNILQQKPSPDMIKGITDEFVLGLPYWKIDLILDYLDQDISKDELVGEGVSDREIHMVQQLVELSSWKRESPHQPAPVQGSRSGGYRISS